MKIWTWLLTALLLVSMHFTSLNAQLEDKVPIKTEKGETYVSADGYTSFVKDLTTNTLRGNSMTVKSNNSPEFYPVLVNVNNSLSSIETNTDIIGKALVTLLGVEVTRFEADKFEKVKEEVIIVRETILEAKAYLAFPILCIFSLILLIIGCRVENKLLIMICSSLFVLLLVGSCIVFPIILTGLGQLGSL